MKKILLGLLILFVITGCGKEKVIIYSSMEENRNQALIEQASKEFPELNVVIQSISTGNSAAKIKNEGVNIEADIILDLETSHMANLKENFADISAYDISMYLEDIDNTNNYLVWSKSTSNVIIDKDYFKKNNLDIPKTYEDLLNDDYKNLIAMPDPKTSGTGYAFLLNAVNVMGEEKAFKYFEKLSSNIREFTASGSGPTNLLKQGEIAIGLGMTSQAVASINEGYNLEIITLDTGAVYNTTSVAIIKGKESNQNVRDVFEWLYTDFNVYDKENFMPDAILKNQEVKLENYPTNFKMGDMTGIESVDIKDELTKKWGEING